MIGCARIVDEIQPAPTIDPQHLAPFLDIDFFGREVRNFHE